MISWKVNMIVSRIAWRSFYFTLLIFLNGRRLVKRYTAKNKTILKMIQESKNIFSTTRSLRSLVVFFNFLKDTNPPILELSLVYHIFYWRNLNCAIQVNYAKGSMYYSVLSILTKPCSLRFERKHQGLDGIKSRGSLP